MQDSQNFVLPSPNFGIINDKQLPSPNFTVKNDKPHALWAKSSSSRTSCFANRKLLSIVDKQIQDAKLEPIKKFVPMVWCEICDLGFSTNEDFEKHNLEHKECGIDGCKFKGNRKILDNHIKEQHLSGIFQKIRKLDTPEEIAQWREERKRRYPTKENVELRRKAQEAKMKRGEKLEGPKNRFGRKEDKRPISNTDKSYKNDNGRMKLQPKRFRKRRSERAETKQLNPQENSKGIDENGDKPCNNLNPKDFKSIEKNILEDKKVDGISSDEEFELLHGIKRFRGTSDLADYNRGTEDKKIKVQGALGFLSMYASSDDCDSEDSDNEVDEFENNGNDYSPLTLKINEHIFKEKESSEVNNTQEITSKDNEEDTLNCKDCEDSKSVKSNSENESGDDKPEEVPILKHDPSIDQCPPQPSINSHTLAKEEKKQRISRPQTRKTLLNYKNLYRKRQNTLLEKLLEPDIRHERNVLLQCVRYVVENDFFGMGKKKSTT